MSAAANIQAVVYQTISETFKIPVSAIHADTTAADVDGWDSVTTSILFFGIEEKIGVELDIERLLQAENVGQLVDAVSRLVHR